MIKKYLKEYDEFDFVGRMKAEFFFKIGIYLLIFITIISLISTSSTIMGYEEFDYKSFSLQIIIIFAVLFGLRLISKGKAELALHFVVFSSMLSVWLIIFLDTSSLLARLDTIAFIYTVLAITPLFSMSTKTKIINYSIFNILLLFILSYYLLSTQKDINFGEIFDFILDNSIAIFFMTYVILNVYMIYEKSIKMYENSNKQALLSEENLKTLNKDLDHMVEQKTNELEVLEEEINNIVKVLAIDLQEPLKELNMKTNIIKNKLEEKLDFEALENLNLMSSKTDTLNKLIQDIIQLNNISKKDLIIEEIDLNNFLSEIVAKFKKFENVHINVSAEISQIKSDKKLLSIVLTNLIENGIIHNNNEIKNIDINCYNNNGKKIVFKVSDNGDGIPNKYFEKIFNLFHSLNSKQNQTGVGLTLVKQIIDLLGGELWLESKPKKGSSFFFSIIDFEN